MPHVSDAAPLTRAELLDLMQGFKKTAVLRAAVRLGVFDALAGGPANAAELATRLAVQARGLRLLLNALTALRLLECDGHRYRLGPGTGPLLVSSEPAYCGGNVYVASSDREWAALGDLAGTVRNGGPIPGTDATAPGFDYWVDFAEHTTMATHGGAHMVADALEPWAAHRTGLRVLDVACGPGVFGFALARRHPDARVVALDRPDVLEKAEEHARAMGVLDRVEFLPGDMFDIPLGGPYDVVLVANVLLHFSAAANVRLLRRLRGVLKPGGRLVIAGFTAEMPPDQLHPHLLSLLMLSWTAEGEVPSAADCERMLADAGLPGAESHGRPGLPIRAFVAAAPG
ncbi:methyltransferase domain-containing protein [Actinomadura formosensis]|uniref:methyltransferase domain-containing protein n=1 Tax=Actinomadura formosensis TaxID=60706 RepID=UPI000835D08E|nr:methyltransferase domain-containing protein [Actinomadura formosensis]